MSSYLLKLSSSVLMYCLLGEGSRLIGCIILECTVFCAVLFYYYILEELDGLVPLG